MVQGRALVNTIQHDKLLDKKVCCRYSVHFGYMRAVNMSVNSLRIKRFSEIFVIMFIVPNVTWPTPTVY